MQILICDPNKIRAQLWATSLLKEVKCQVIVTHNDLNALAYIDTIPTLDLIIAPVVVNNRDIGLTLANKLRQKSKSLQLLLYGKPLCRGDGIIYLEREPLIGKLIRIVQQLQLTEVQNDNNLYRSIPLILIKGLKNISVDIYLNLSKTVQSHFVKIVSSGERDFLERVEIYEHKSVSQFWVKDSDFPLIIAEILQDSIQQKIQQDEQTQTPLDELISNYYIDLGIPETIIQNKQQQFQMNFKDLLKGLQQKGLEGYITQGSDYLQKMHAIGTGIIASIMLDSCTWSLPEQHRFVQTAAILMDIEIKTKEAFHVRTQEDFDQLQMLRGDKFSLVNHAKISSEKLLTTNLFPEEIIRLVKHHHGTINGIGFTLAPEDQLYQIHWLFNISEEISFFLLQNQFQHWNFTQLEASLRNRYATNKIAELCLTTLRQQLITA